MQRLKEMRRRLNHRTAVRSKRRKEFALRQRDEAYKQSRDRKRQIALRERDLAYRRAHGGGDEERKEPSGVAAVDEGEDESSEIDPDWRPASDPRSGRTYFYNVRTRETSWTPPRSPAAAAAATADSPSSRRYVSLDDIRSGHEQDEVDTASTEGVGDSTHVMLRRELDRQRKLRSKLDFLKSQMQRKRAKEAETAGGVKMSLYRALVAFGERAGRGHSGWYYRDQDDRIQGPYSSRRMRKWFTDGYIADDLPLRFGRVGPFRPLSEVFAGCGSENPFILEGRKDLQYAAERVSNQLGVAQMRHRTSK